MFIVIVLLIIVIVQCAYSREVRENTVESLPYGSSHDRVIFEIAIIITKRYRSPCCVYYLRGRHSVTDSDKTRGHRTPFIVTTLWYVPHNIVLFCNHICPVRSFCNN